MGGQGVGKGVSPRAGRARHGRHPGNPYPEDVNGASRLRTRSATSSSVSRASIVRAVAVATTIATSVGKAKRRACPVSSIMITSAEIGPCVVAAIIAPAPTTA